MIRLLDAVTWGDLDGYLGGFKTTLRLLREATRDDLALWEEEGEQRFPDEFSVPAEDVAGLSDSWHRAYVARLAWTLELSYGANDNPDEAARPFTPGDILRALNDITWLP